MIKIGYSIIDVFKKMNGGLFKDFSKIRFIETSIY